MEGSKGRGRVGRRQGRLGIVAALLGIQVLVALLAFGGARPARYGWQMYSAVPAQVAAWSIHGDEERELDIESRFVHSRAEIDRAALVRERGCDLTRADEIRLELADGSTETVPCH